MLSQLREVIRAMSTGLRAGYGTPGPGLEWYGHNDNNFSISIFL